MFSFTKPAFLHAKQQSVTPLLPSSSSPSPPPSPAPSFSAYEKDLVSPRRKLRPSGACKRAFLALALVLTAALVASHWVRLDVQVKWAGEETVRVGALAADGVSAAGKATGSRVVSPGAPHAMIRDSLVPGLRYATTAPGAGLNNQVTAVVELLRYAQLAGRVPILGDFVSYPIIQTYPHPPAPQISFETVFDLELYERLSGQQTTTFSRLKLPSSPVETLPCFQTMVRSDTLHGVARPQDVGGIDWTPHPEVDLSVWAGPVVEPFGRALKLDALRAFSEAPGPQWEDWVDGVAAGVPEEDRPLAQARPEQDLVCWADLYWAAETDNVFAERWNGGWPAWETAGRHLHFAPPLKRQAAEYLRHILGGEERPFIAIHARHGDFGCPDASSAAADRARPDASPSACFRPAASYLPAVSHLRTSLAELKNTAVGPADVIVFSDEEDEAWWADVKELGWKRADHRLMGTKERWDNWYPTLLDMVMMASAKGFIGTPGSTYSLFASLRVRDWNDGMAVEESR